MADETSATPATASAKKRKLVPLLAVMVLMMGEGIAVYLVTQAMSPDVAPAHADEMSGKGHGAGDHDMDASAEFSEIAIAECRPNNKTTGKLINFHMRVSGLVARDKTEQATKLVTENSSRLLDRINYVVRSAEIQHFNEPGLETIKRRLKQEFDRIFKDEELIKEVLIPELLQSGFGV